MIYSKTSFIELKSPLLEERDVTVLVQREDLNHPAVSGNKWWKLKYNVQQALQEKKNSLLTFGGAYSNHIYATASAAKAAGLQSIGVIRGEKVLPLNPTLTFAERMGMRLHFVDRSKYRRKHDPESIEMLRKDFGNFYLIPEGGTNALAIKGCEEWAQQLIDQFDFDYLCLPVGTGGTMAGMVNILRNKKVIGFSSLKGGSFLNEEVSKWIHHSDDNWSIQEAYHFGGYGKVTSELIAFINSFEAKHKVPLDPIYTAKMMYGIMDMINGNKFKKTSRILALHTGGLQGRASFNF